MVVAGAAVLSLGGIAVGAWITKPSDGGRGGAIAVALAFLILFIRRDYGARLYQAIVTDIPGIKDQITNLRQGREVVPTAATDAATLHRQFVAIVSRLDTEADGQNRQNGALAWASCIGTIAWGFGDIVACWLQRFR